MTLDPHNVTLPESQGSIHLPSNPFIMITIRKHTGPPTCQESDSFGAQAVRHLAEFAPLTANLCELRPIESTIRHNHPAIMCLSHDL